MGVESFRYFVSGRGVISLVREWVWSHFVISSVSVESFRYFVSECGVISLVRE